MLFVRHLQPFSARLPNEEASCAERRCNLPGYKPITSSLLQAAGLVTPQQACYKGLVMLYELASFVTKLVTKLVSHYEYFARNEARYEARNASVCRATSLRGRAEGARIARMLCKGF